LKILVKLGGTLLDSAESRRRLASEISSVQVSGVRVVVVHGGGKQMTRFLSERGIESKFVGGLRVTTPDVIDAVLKVLAGSVNHELVASLVEAGALAVGLSGIDACLTEAEQMNVELGAVGRPVRSNAKVLEVLTANGYLPVVACVAGDRAGRIYNVNADQMAVACASGFGVDRLIFLTDVEGVKDREGAVLPLLTAADCEQLIESGVATGGMQA
jgi:acetylglutamate kinase